MPNPLSIIVGAIPRDCPIHQGQPRGAVPTIPAANKVKSRTSRLYFLALVALAALALFQPAAADSDPDPYSSLEFYLKYRQVVDQLGCIQCVSRPLLGCETPTCQDAKALIRQKLAAGESPDQIVQFFVDRYGDAILLNPPARGFNLLIWILPVVALMAGALAILVLLAKKGQAKSRLSPAPLGDEYESRVMEEVRAIERSRG